MIGHRFVKLTALGLGLLFATSLASAPSQAHGCFGCGVVGGLAVGTIAGAAIQNGIDRDRDNVYYGPAPGCIDHDGRWYCD